MIENARSQLLWDSFMANPEIAPTLTALGFVADSDPPVGVPPAATALPRALRLVASPNPSAGAMSFALELPIAGPADVEVFDISGRRIALAQHGQLAAGRHAIPWDGRGADGTALPPGVYLARVRAGDNTTATRFVRVR